MDYASKNGLISECVGSMPRTTHSGEPSVEVVEKPRAEPVRKTVEKPVAEKPRAVDFSNAKAPRVAERVPVMSSKPVAPKSKVAEPKAVEKPKSSYAQFVSAEMKNRPAGVSAKDYMKEIGAKWRESR